ncbi:VOC family protein [Aquihabitans daechungensis]|uniref:VOC family protein n=1 Tax=Aquihabitans daechungensis TaxID=1052257 RepID=UPI003BA2F653
MTMRLEAFTIDARDPRALATWWSEAIGWVICFEDDEEGEFNLCERLDPDGTHPFPELSFVRVDDAEQGQERVHVDLNSFSAADQEATVDRLLDMGATRADVGQAADAPFTVLADPDGNHFCVLDPRPEYAHLGSVAGFTLASHDAGALRDLWAAATAWDITTDEPGYVVLTPPTGGFPFEIITRPTMPRGDAKNRIHIDVAPSADEDQAEVVARLIDLGARKVDVGQTGDESWVPLADPEGNELCVLSPRD